MNDPNRWQPLQFLGGGTSQGGEPINEATQKHLSPFWGEVTPFAITAADRTPHGGYYVYHDQGPPRSWVALPTLNSNSVRAGIPSHLFASRSQRR